jgi:membrane fusion protein (multidrug efflux system)
MKSTVDTLADPAVAASVAVREHVATEPRPAVEAGQHAHRAEAPDAPSVRPVREPDAAPPSNDSVKQAGTAPWLGRSVQILVLLLALGLVLGIARDWNQWVGSAIEQSTDDAYLRADATPLAAKSAGYVRSVPVNDFQRVKAGDVLVEIVDDDYRAALDQAQANVDAAHAAIGIIQRQKLLQQALIKQAEATIAATQADLDRYHLETVRQQRLLETRIAGTDQLVEQAVDNEKRTAATLDLNRAQLEQQRQQLSVLDNQEQQANATLKAQEGARDLAKIALGYTRITAPVDGMVSERQVRPGQYVSAGTEVITVVPLPGVWVVANYKETQMNRIRAGQPARVTVDAFAGATLHGHVDSWSPASGAQLSLLPPDNATGNFTKVVQRIPVKIVLDPDPALDDLLRAGMSVVAVIDTSSRSDGAAAGKPAR